MADFDPTDMRKMSASKKGGNSARVPMKTGQEQTSPGPSMTFPHASPFTVRFSVLPPNIDSTADAYGNFDCIADIRYTVEGNSVERQVTVANGVAISGTADSVNIDIQDITPGTDPQGVDYSVMVHVTPGIRSGYALPPTLEAFTSEVNGANVIESGPITVVSTATYPVPQRAGVISVEVVVTGDVAGVDVTMGTPNGNFKKYHVSPGENFGFIVMAPNSAFLTITALGDTASDVTVTWGIEG